jgi:hypothetical protein
MICQCQFFPLAESSLELNLWMQPKAASISPIMLALKTKSTKFVDSLQENGEIFATCATYFYGSGLKAANRVRANVGAW